MTVRPLAALLVALVALAAVGTAWLWSDGGEPPLPPPLAAPAPGDDEPAAAVTAVAAERDEFEPAAADAALEPGDEGDDGDERVFVPVDQRRAPRVQVLRAGQPVEGAVVYFVLEADARERLARSARQPGRWEWPQAFGQRATTDGEGLATLPVAPAPWLCAAVAGGDFGVANVPPRDRTFPIHVQPDEQVTLLARTAEDAPAPGVPVAVLQQFDRGEARVCWQGVSDAHGRASLPHFQLLRETRNPAPSAERFAAVAMLPAAVAVEFAGRPAPADPVRVEVPPVGRLQVQLVDHAGNALLTPAIVALAAFTAPAFAAETAFRLPRNLAAQRTDKPAGDAPVELPFVEVGTPLRVHARFALDRRPVELTLPAGPARAGQTLAAVLPLRGDQAVLAGALRLAPEQPLASGRADAALWNAQRDVLATAVHTVADGSFDLVLPQRSDGAEFWLELRHELAPTVEGEPPLRLGARVRVPAIRGGARIELGAIVLEPLPPCVHGVVVDDAGEPIARADVQVQQAEPPRGEGRPETWRRLPLYRARTDAQGAFVVDGHQPPGRLRVHADSNRHFADAVPLHTPGQQVRIVLARNGVLRGQVLLPPWLADGTASLQLRPFDAAQRERDTRTIALGRRRGGRFVAEPLRPGRFDALVLVRNLRDPIAMVPDVFVVPGETRDRRLQPLDLRSALHRYRLRALDAAGTPLAIDGPILARVPGADGAIVETAFRWRRGRAELITGSPTAELVFFGRGHQTVRELLAAGDSDVRMPANRPALVELPGARALCGPTRRVRVSVLLQGDTGLPGSLGGVDQRSGERFGFQRWDLGRSSGAWLGAGDAVEIPLMQSGKYEVLLRPHAGDTERSPQAQVSLGVFELSVDSPSWVPVRVPVDPVAVGQALQQLDQRWAQQQAQAAARPRPQGAPRTPGPPGRR